MVLQLLPSFRLLYMLFSEKQIMAALCRWQSGTAHWQERTAASETNKEREREREKSVRVPCKK